MPRGSGGHGSAQGMGYWEHWAALPPGRWQPQVPTVGAQPYLARRPPERLETLGVGVRW